MAAPGKWAVQGDDRDADALAWHARLCLAGGDTDGYPRVYAHLLEHFDPLIEPDRAGTVARTVIWLDR
jgi:hypothetical protein